MSVPISFNGLSDGIHRIRQLADKYTPGVDTLANIRAWPWMAPLYGAAQGDILPPRTGSAFVRPSAPSAPQAGPAPSIPAMGGLGLFPAAQAKPMSWLQSAQQAQPMPPPSQAPAPDPAPAPALSQAPMPQARPASAPQAPPDMSFFQRNAAMMRDPGTGAFIDPNSAAQAQVRGPDLIAKMMSYLHNKDIG